MSYMPSLVPDTEECKLHNYYDAQSCVLSAICILIGTVMCFFGFCFTYILCSLYLTDELSGKALQYKDKVFLGISVGVGFLVGLLTLCLFYVGLFFLGATLGWFIGMAFLPLLYKHSEYLSENNWLPYVILATCAIAGGILILCIQKVVIVISTSFQGAFFFVNGVDYFVENSKALYYSLNILHGDYDKSFLPHCWYTWVILSLIPVMFVAGMVVQFCKTGKDSDHREAYGRGRRSHGPIMGTPLQDFSDQQPILSDYD